MGNRVRHGNVDRVKFKFWKLHFEKFEKSQKKQAEYCRENGLKVNQFIYWHRKVYINSAPVVKLVQVAPVQIQPRKIVEDKCGCNEPGLTLSVGNKYSIGIKENFSSKTLVRLIRILNGVG